MKKNRLFLFVLLTIFALCLFACKKEAPKYNVLFVTNCEVKADAAVVEKASDIQLPEVAKEGYKLIGWYTDSEYKNEFKADLALEADAVLYAKWEVLKYKVKFMNGSELIEEQEVEYGNAATAPANPAKEGYDFVKWDKEYAAVKADLVVNAEFKIKEFDVKFMDGSREIATVKVEYGKAATAPTNTEKAGYNFIGWDKEFSDIKANLTVNANYDAIQYNVSYFDGASALNLAPAKVTNGSTEALPVASKAGYIFGGWYDSAEFTNKVVSFANVASDINLYAKFYTVKYYDGETEITTLAAAKIEDGIVVVPAYAVEGYVFAGWYKDDKFNVPFDPEEVVNSDLALKALLVKIDYNGGAASWTSTSWGENDPAKGIDPISDLPEYFEKDFFKYLSDEGLLDSTTVGDTVKADSWAKFSGVNPIHSGDPKRIWNDSTQNKANDSSDGYMALYLFGSLEVDKNGKLIDIIGGFLGNEPYKTKYFNVMQQLIDLYNGKYNYDTVDPYGDNNSARQLYAFLLDGWFYGTQGLKKDNGQFDSARKIVPTTSRGYTWSGSALTPYDNVYGVTTDNSDIQKLFAEPFGATEFDGWYLDAEGNTKLTEENITNRMTIYAKWK